MIIAHNIAILLLFLPVYQLTFFTIQLITFKKRTNQARREFGLFLFSILVFLIINTLFYINYPKVLVWAYYLFAPVFLLQTPLFYNYIVKLTNTNIQDSMRNNMLLYSPAVLLFLLNIITYGSLSGDEKLIFLLSGISIQNISFVSVTFYFGFIFLALGQMLFFGNKIIKLIKYHKSVMQNDNAYLPSVDLRWLVYIFISLFAIIITNIFFFLLSIEIRSDALWGYDFIMIIAVSIIGFLGMKQENLNEYALRLSAANFNNNLKKSSNQELERSVNISTKEKEEAFILIKHFMRTKKPFLNSRLSISDLATDLNINRRVISIAVNDLAGKNIYSFINEYRVEEAKKLISSSELSNLCIEAVAEKAGFTSKSCFNRRFKKSTGITPSKYKQVNSKE